MSEDFITVRGLTTEPFIKHVFWRTSSEGAECARKICGRGGFLQTNEDFTMYRAPFGPVWLLGMDGWIINLSGYQSWSGCRNAPTGCDVPAGK